jgi:oligosaccharide repeat unit polymerase
MSKIFFLCVSLFCIIMMISAIEPDSAFSYSVFITSIIIQIFSIYNIFTRENEPYSLFKVFSLFSLFFFGIAPLLQFYNSTIIWYYRPLSEWESFITNVLVIVILFFYKIMYDFFRKYKISEAQIRKINSYSLDSKIGFKKSLLLIIISLLSFFLVFQSNNYNIFVMIIRGGDLLSGIMDVTEADNSPTKWLIINNFVRPMSMMCFFYYANSANKNKITFVVLLILALITCFPTGMPRFAAAAMYIPFMLLIFKYTRKKNVFSLIFIFGLLVVFPFLNVFRTLSDDTDVKVGLDFDMFLQGHFDSYQNFALIISSGLITYGRQLLGVILFWVPRSIWADKPIGSGAFAAEKMNFVFDNVAANYFAEGYINFGFLGVALFLIGLAYVTAKLDSLFWQSVGFTDNNYFSVLYTVSLGFLFFILRGDLLSSSAYTFGFLFSALLVYRILRLKITYNIKDK